MDHLDILQELAKILRGDHGGWKGDRRLNGYAFLRRVADSMPEVARRLASAIEKDPAGAAVWSGISPGTIGAVSKALRGEVTSI